MFVGSEQTTLPWLDENRSRRNESETASDFENDPHEYRNPLDYTGENPQGFGPFGKVITTKKSIGGPVLLVSMPILLFCAVLLGLVFMRQVRAVQDVLLGSDPFTYKRNTILVDYPATRLTFLASWLSTLAPLLTATVMSLWTLRVSRVLCDASKEPQNLELPMAKRMGMLIENLLGSFMSLKTYYGTLILKVFRVGPSKSVTSELPPVVHGTAMVFSLCAVLVLVVLASETYLDVFTKTVQIETPSMSGQANFSSGRGLSTYCLDFDRLQNFGFPCSYPLIEQTDAQTLEGHEDAIEVYFLQHNSSRVSEIRFESQPSLQFGDLALLLPQTSMLSGNLDFRATTIGLSTQCRPISSQCNMRVSESDPDHTIFNCSMGFWGVMGKAPNITEINEDDDKAIDPDLPGLNIKPSPNLQYGFYTDETFSTPYNTAIFNATTGDLVANVTPIADSSLLNPVHLAVAGRFALSSESVGSNLSSDANIFTNPNLTYADFALACHYTTYSVTYSWINNTIKSVDFQPTPNGSIAEIYHGRQLPFVTPTDTNFLLQDDVLTAALQNTSAALAKEWANLHSVRALATIGAYTTPRSNLQEQLRTPRLVTQLPTAALAALIAGSMSYVVLTLVLGVVALLAARAEPDVLHCAAYLSIDGLAATAFRGGRAGERVRVGFEPSGSGDKGTPFALYADDGFRSEPTHVEMQSVALGKRNAVVGAQQVPWQFGFENAI